MIDDNKKLGEDAALEESSIGMNNLAQQVGDWAHDHGFREDWELADEIQFISERSRYFANNADGRYAKLCMEKSVEALRTAHIGMKLMLAVSELSEAMERLRDVGASGVLAGDENFGEEIADTHIRLFDLAQMTDQPVGEITVEKVKKNRTRPYKHGRRV